jgi:hypothetical protein
MVADGAFLKRFTRFVVVSGTATPPDELLPAPAGAVSAVAARLPFAGGVFTGLLSALSAPTFVEDDWRTGGKFRAGELFAGE